jgi:CelD/BcsL family acetyltransferase involved in cellulose biosynthesis
VITPLALAKWEAFDRAHPGPTFFSRPAFALAYCDVNERYEPWPLRIDYGGKQYIMPAVRTRSVLGMRALIAFPLGGYGCILDERGETVGAHVAAELLGLVGRDVHSLTYIAWPLGSQPTLKSDRETYHTSAIDCSAGFDNAVAGMRGVTRRMAAQALRRGVVCRRSLSSPQSVSRYYAILEEASAGWGLARPTISHALLDAVVRWGGDDVELWFAELGEETVAGGVVLFGSEELFFWSAAMRRDYAAYRPSNALNMSLIARACERGVRWYNLGASEGLAGVERFKHDLGARDVSYSVYSIQNRTYRLYEHVRNAIGAMLPT